MNRTTAAALIAAGVVGLVGGTVSAVVRGSSGPTASSPPGSSPSPSPSPRTVLYAGDKTIHDGDQRIRYRAPFDTPDRLVRSATGYLIAQSTSPQEPSFRIYAVAEDGATTRVADVLGDWDVNEQGDHVVGTDLDSGRVTTWDLTGSPTARGPKYDGPATAVWQGDRVLISAHLDSQDPWRLFTWDPTSGKTKQTAVPGMADLTVSPDGTLLGGAVGVEGFTTDNANPCLRVAATPGSPATEWTTCDWRANGGATQLFSPAGTRVLAVPAQTDGFGPGQFATFSAEKGPSGGVRTFLTPDLTMDAAWLDEDHLLLIGATDADLTPETGRWIRLCDLTGECTEVTTRAPGKLVLGEQS